MFWRRLPVLWRRKYEYLRTGQGRKSRQSVLWAMLWACVMAWDDAEMFWIADPRKRRKMQVTKYLHNLWAALRGRTYVSMRGHCFACGHDFYLEHYSDALFPMVKGCRCPDPVRFDMARFNDNGFYPTVRSQLPPRILENCLTGH